MVTSQDKQRLEDLVAVAAVSDHRTRGDLNGLLEELQRAVVDAKDVPADVITMNSRADMLDLDSGETISFTLVFPPDAHIEKGKISVLGADGARMLGYRVRDEFEWNVADDYGE